MNDRLLNNMQKYIFEIKNKLKKTILEARTMFEFQFYF